MRTSKYPEAQKGGLLRGALRRQVDAATPVVELCRSLDERILQGVDGANVVTPG